MPRTGETCETSGIYNGTCDKSHVKQISLSEGERFPPCRTASCQGAVTWTLFIRAK